MAVAQGEVSEFAVTGRTPVRPSGAHYVPPAKKTESGMIRAYAVQTILEDAEPLYQLWSRVEWIPRWQEYVISVIPKSAVLSHWVMGDPDDADGKRIEFDSEITASEPGKLIAWRSITEGVDLVGTVTFEATPRGTRVTLVQDSKVPGGAFGSALVGAAKRSPEQLVKENLRHFKQLAEAGEIPNVVGQPNGPRGLSGKIKNWMYGENNPTPPGTSTY